MSNRILFDPALVRALSRELDRLLRGRACGAAPVFRAGRVAVLPLDAGRALELDLHPTRGWIRVVDEVGDGRPADSVCTGVWAPPDERLLVIGLRSGDRFRSVERRVIVELHTNQWNVLVVSVDDDRILAALRPRVAGDRVLRPGAVYRAPAGEPRFGAGAVDRQEAWERWRGEILDGPVEARRAALLRGFAYVGSTTAGPLLDAGGEPGDRASFEQWWRLRGGEGTGAWLVGSGAGLRVSLVEPRGVAAERVPTVLAALERVAAGGAERPRPTDPDRMALLERVAARLRTAERRLAGLERQAAGAGEAARWRAHADLLLANLHRLERGSAQVVLTGWSGEEVRLELDPALSGAENVARLYEAARRRGRAEARLPELLEAARGEVARWGAAAEATLRGEPPAWLREAAEREPPPAAEARGGPRSSTPYRTYRTSGGLEVRVGRSARDNDRLTFGHSSPNDVWLHARSVTGSHVVLRWRDEAAPPARDLQQAAALAAVHSRARTSATVAVDWTRRKYVRKPRGAAPGAVSLLRAKTLFVEPDAKLEARLRVE